MDHNKTRYEYLQSRRAEGTITDDEVEEFKIRAYQELINKIEGDPALMNVFKRLKNR